MVICLSLLTIPNKVMAKSSFNMTQGVTEISGKVYDLHMLIFYICCAIALVVFGAMFYAIINHRQSKGAVAAKFHESTKVEVIWTVIPVLILIAMAIPATTTLMAMEDTSKSDLTIKITGSQWKWHYSYFGQEIEFFSLLATSSNEIDGIEEKGAHYLLEVNHPLVLPINRKIRFLLTSDDVIHSWWVPDFAVKKDTVPGFINEAWTKIDKAGIYRGQCTELCGQAHGFMPIVVHAMEENDYEIWQLNKKQEIEQQKLEAAKSLANNITLEALMIIGKKVYLERCSVCHQPNGLGLGAVFPAISGSPIATGDVSIHIDTVVNGRSGTAMQPFANQLTDKEIAAVITYQRNAWDNKTGDAIQASDINAFKNLVTPSIESENVQ